MDPSSKNPSANLNNVLSGRWKKLWFFFDLREEIRIPGRKLVFIFTQLMPYLHKFMICDSVLVWCKPQILRPWFYDFKSKTNVATKGRRNLVFKLLILEPWKIRFQIPLLTLWEFILIYERFPSFYTQFIKRTEKHFSSRRLPLCFTQNVWIKLHTWR